MSDPVTVSHGYLHSGIYTLTTCRVAVWEYTMYIHIRNGNNESLFHAPRVLRGSKGSGASMAIRVSGPTDQSAPGVVLVDLGF